VLSTVSTKTRFARNTNFRIYTASKSNYDRYMPMLLHKTTLTTNPVQAIRMDNAGKNKKLAQNLGSVDWKLGNIKIEYTARDTPQHNHLAELAFATIANQGRALMVHANIPLKLRYKFCAEAFKVATLLDGFSIVAIDGKSQSWFEHYTGCKPPIAKFLRIWGEAATIKVKNFATTKVEDHGVHCMFVGYAKDHTGDCYRMWNPKTQGVMETRDCIWLKPFYFPKPAVPYDVSIAPYDKESITNSVGECIGMVETVTNVEVGESTPFVASTDEPVVVVEPDAVVVNAQNNDNVASLAEV
jgi:hypothetical protein